MREIKLFVIGAEVCEQIEAFVERAVGLRIGLVDLVEHNDRPQPKRQRLGGHKLGLRHRAFGGIDQQNNAIDHRQDPLHLTAEIGVAGGVDDVDPGALVFHRGRLGEDGDPALTLQVIGIHGAFGHGLTFAEGARLLQKGIHQRGFAMINVRDDRDIAEVHGRSGLSKGELPAA